VYLKAIDALKQLQCYAEELILIRNK